MKLKTILLIAGLILFSGCANKNVKLSKPIPLLQKDNIESMNEDFDLYVLNTFKNIDKFKEKVDKKILDLNKKEENNNMFIYYK